MAASVSGNARRVCVKRQRRKSAGALAAFVPEPEIHIPTLEKLVQVGCTDGEIARFFDLPFDSWLYRKRQEHVAKAIRRAKAQARVMARIQYHVGPRIVRHGMTFRKA